MFLNSISAEEIARTLGGRKVGQDWMARCPAHRDKNPSLAIAQRGDRVLVYCHAGCAQRAVIAALRRRTLGISQCQQLASGARARQGSTHRGCRQTQRSRICNLEESYQRRGLRR